jgi:uncharacterized protein YcbX
VAEVVELWRFPVKSLLGERVDALELDARGAVGDRLWAIRDRDGKLASGKTTRRFRRFDGLFELAAAGLDPPRVTLPDGAVHAAGSPALDAWLSGRYGEPLEVAREAAVPHHDAGPVHLLTTSSLRWLREELPAAAVDSRRFRANVVLETDGDGRVEEEWIGRRVALGSAVLRITGRTERCVMATNAQGELPHDPSILRALAQRSDACLGVLAEVERPGRIRLGDPLVL